MAKKFYEENNEPIPAVRFLEEGSQPVGWVEVTSADRINTLTKKLYLQREQDGRALYDDIRAQLAKDFNSGELTLSDAHFIETKLVNAKSFLLTGDWATAEYELSLLVIEGAYTQELHDDINLNISNYMTLNY